MQTPSSTPSSQVSGSLPVSRYTILIADDIEENLDLLEDVLGEQGFGVVRARNGLQALEALRATPVHLIIADAMMPRMDGFELCKAVRSEPSVADVPLIIRTANYIDKEDEEFARKLGADKYLVKNPGLESLVNVVNELLHDRSGAAKVAPLPGPEPHASRAAIDDPTFLERHHTMVSRKLEEKMAELEMYAETLNKRNRELQASEARYRSLFEHAGVAIFVIDRQTAKILEVNKIGTALVHSTREEILAMENFSFVENPGFLSSLSSVSEFSLVETTLKTRAHEAIDVEIGVGPVTQPNDARLILFIRDITEQRKMRQQLMEAEKMMMMGCFATGIAHEIRNPLTAIALNLQYLLHKYGAQPDIREYVDAAFEATRRLGNVVENTLNLARRTPLTLKPDNLNQIVDEALRFIRIPLQEKNIRLTKEMAETLPAVYVDAKEVKQAMLNLLQNAVEVSPVGGRVTVSTGTVQAVEKNHGRLRVELSIADSGPGITPDDLAHLFEPLRTTKSGGTGLGLALSKHIMERHGGEISLEPLAGGGTRARLVFNTLTETNGGTHVQR